VAVEQEANAAFRPRSGELVPMEERILEWDRLTPEIVRTWGYDEDLLLSSQDEDLCLYNWEFVPVLLELAGDERCPKGTYAFWILCQFCREQVTRGGERGTAALRAAWSTIPEPTGGYPLEWHQYARRLLGYTEPSGPVDKPTAQRIAQDLLIGAAGRVGEVIEDTPALPGWWRFTLRTSFTEHVDVCQKTGAFSYSYHYRI
jgi:hypothetical protein